MTERRDRGVVAIVGRPNVGKSTLFNRIAGRRIAIEEPMPGVTRDRIYADCEWRRKRFTLVDTGGLQLQTGALESEIRRQVEFAIEEADVIVLVVDAHEGMAGLDQEIAELLRRTGKFVVVAANKVDSKRREDGVPDFYALALGEVIAISAAHGLLVDDLLDAVWDRLPETEEAPEDEDVIRAAILGRPNVGKSSLLNAILGQQRVVVDATPGTTRDAIDTPYTWRGNDMILVDTAGIRRKSKVRASFEYYSVLRAFGAVDRCDVALTLIDAQDGLTDQDKRLAGYAHEQGRAQILVVSKWDLRAPKDTPANVESSLASDFSQQVTAWLPEISYAPVVFISSLEARGIDLLLDTAVAAAEQHSLRLQTAEVNRIMEEATWRRPLSRRGRQLKIYYAVQVSVRPPTIVLFVNDPELMHFSHLAYLENQMRARYPMVGTPLRLLVRKSRGKDDKRE
jgi:GTP-binding protein